MTGKGSESIKSKPKKKKKCPHSCGEGSVGRNKAERRGWREGSQTKQDGRRGRASGQVGRTVRICYPTPPPSILERIAYKPWAEEDAGVENGKVAEQVLGTWGPEPIQLPWSQGTQSGKRHTQLKADVGGTWAAGSRD